MVSPRKRRHAAKLGREPGMTSPAIAIMNGIGKTMRRARSVAQERNTPLGGSEYCLLHLHRRGCLQARRARPPQARPPSPPSGVPPPEKSWEKEESPVIFFKGWEMAGQSRHTSEMALPRSIEGWARTQTIGVSSSVRRMRAVQ